MPTSKPSPAELRNMFGRNLRKLASAYPSISELSRQLKINRTQFNRYLSGESFPRPDILYRICQFFGVDARILLEPVADIKEATPALNGPFLEEFLGTESLHIPEEMFPSGFYRFTRRSFVFNHKFLVGLVYIFREGPHTMVRGYESRFAMQEQGLPASSREREFRGLVSRQEDGIALMISRRNAFTSSFNFLSRVSSFDNNFWVGYLTRTVREDPASSRAERMVYEYIGPLSAEVIAAARVTGLHEEEELMPFHHRLLQPKEPFR